MNTTTAPALLALADGRVFYGKGFGHCGVATGEVVFNTAMTGYQEILTDPSYAAQMVTLTYPHIGNVGTNAADSESQSCFATGLIIKATPKRASNYRSEQTLADFMRAHRVVGIEGLDVRALTQHIRQHGAQNGVIVTDGSFSEAEAIAQAKALPSMTGQDLAQEVSTEKPYVWTEGTLDIIANTFGQSAGKYHVVAYDFGVKRNILRLLADRDCRLTVVPAETPAAEVLALKPDGIFLSNGPGDPGPCDYAIEAVQELLTTGIPIFGICLGHQILALASGARARKMKFGHHGANHPVKDLATGQVAITSQNHGFDIDENTLPEQLIVTHRSLFDNTVQGIARTDCEAFGFQGHPEASPGPQDIHGLFDRFIGMMDARQRAMA